MIEITTTLVSPEKAEQRFYDKDGKLVEIRTIISPGSGIRGGTTHLRRRLSFGTTDKGQNQ